MSEITSCQRHVPKLAMMLYGILYAILTGGDAGSLE
jgi:hypothetical protein